MLKINSGSILSIECDFTIGILFEDVIRKFAETKLENSFFNIDLIKYLF